MSKVVGTRLSLLPTERAVLLRILPRNNGMQRVQVRIGVEFSTFQPQSTEGILLEVDIQHERRISSIPGWH